MTVDPEPPRRNIEEVIALYRLEPDLVDYYVEGRSDRVFFDHLLGDMDAKVMEIDEIDVPLTLLSELGLEPGERSEVIALAQRLDAHLSPSVDYRVRCIIDADFDRLFEASPFSSARFLRFTDFSCLESYLFDSFHLTKFRRLGLHNAARVSEDLAATLSGPVRRAYALRAAARSLNVRWEWLDPSSFCRLESGAIVFDEAIFIERLVNKNAAYHQRDAFQKQVEEISSNLPNEVRNTVHGHDLIAILAWYIRRTVRDQRLGYMEAVARTLACCFERERTRDHPLLVELTTLATGPQN